MFQKSQHYYHHHHPDDDHHQQESRTAKAECFSEVIELLRLEAAAIERAAAQLDCQQVEQAVDMLAVCAGKVILIGVGKSGIIAQKIAATMTSTGTAAIYLHPSDALHGGLGIIGREDVVIALSNSGETDQLIQMMPYIKSRDARVIAIVGNLRSTLARGADVVLDATVDREACPLNLAPTTSTTVALAIGDALAMVLMRSRGWTPNDYALNHPAGRLGKRLTLKVGDLMHGGTRNPTLAPDALWLDVIQTISRGGLGAACVVDEYERLVGIITDGDLRRALGRCDPANLGWLTSRQIMTQDPVTASPDLLAYDALRLMEERSSQISVLPVVDDERRAVGLIRLHDIVRNGL